jgi:hypothetical protein
MATPLQRFQNGRNVGNVTQTYTAGQPRRATVARGVGTRDTGQTMDDAAEDVARVFEFLFGVLAAVIVGLFVWLRDNSPIINRFARRAVAFSIARPNITTAVIAAVVLACMTCWGVTIHAMPWQSAEILIRTWPASETSIDGVYEGWAPARLPVKVRSGKHEIRFVPADKSLSPQSVNIELPVDGSLEIRVDLQFKKCGVIDRKKSA